MKIYNAVTNTNPIAIHAQGGSYKAKPEFRSLSWDIIHQINEPKPDDLTIVVFAYGRERKMLLKQLDDNGIPYVNSVIDHKGDWNNVWKIKYFYSILPTIKTKYVVSLDTVDVLLAENFFTELYSKFEALNCKALYGASKANYPPMTIDDDDITTGWNYLNGGTLFGETDYIKAFYDELILEVPKNYEPYQFSEQMRIRSIWNNYKPEMKADYGCEIFQTLNQSNYTYDKNTNILTILD